MYGLEHLPEGARKVTVSLALLFALPIMGYQYAASEKDKEMAQIAYQHDQELIKVNFEHALNQIIYNRERSDKIIERETGSLGNDLASLRSMLNEFIADDQEWREAIDERIDELEH